MPAVSMVFGSLATQLGYGVDAVTFDAVVNEVFKTSATVTSHPVEDGSDISDHIKDDPDELQLDGCISNTPGIPGASIGGQVSPTRAEDEFEKLLALKEAKQALSVLTSKREYEDMVITSIQRTRNAAVGDSVEVSISLRKIRKVKARLAEMAGAPVRQERKPRQDIGKQTKKPATEAQKKSLAATGWDAIFGANP